MNERLKILSQINLSHGLSTIENMLIHYKSIGTNEFNYAINCSFCTAFYDGCDYCPWQVITNAHCLDTMNVYSEGCVDLRNGANDIWTTKRIKELTVWKMLYKTSKAI